MNPTSWIESPAQRADRLERERDDALAKQIEVLARLSEARRNWERVVWAFWAVAMTNVAVLLIVGGSK